MIRCTAPPAPRPARPILRLLLPALLALAAPAAADAPDPLVTRLVAAARSLPPASLAFEQTSRAVARDSAGKTETTVTVERWDGKAWTLVSRNGKPPTPKEADEARKARAKAKVPGYYRIAEYLAGGARKLAEANGQARLRIAPLPKGSINISGDRSEKFEGEVTIDTSGGQPVATRVHLFAPKPFSMMLVARIDSFDVVNEYRPGPDGRPLLVRQVQNLSGSQFGSTGSIRTEIDYRPLR